MLRLFADFAELSRNRPAGEDLRTELRVHSPKEHFHTYLQTLDTERAGLPAEFLERLARVLGHYGVTDLDRSDELTTRCSGSSWPSSARLPTYCWSRRCCSSGWSRPQPEAPLDADGVRRARPARARHPAALPGGR